jgi:hypothetical protein
VAPFPLLTFQDVKKRAELIGLVVEKRLMPPWKAEPGFGEFTGDRRLGEREIRTIEQWIKEGAPEGRAEDLPPKPQVTDGWRLGKPDLVLKMAKPYTVPAGGPEFYRCFPVPAGLAQDQYVVGLEYRPSNRRLIHHAIITQDLYHAGRLLEKEPGEGYPCSGGFGFPAQGIFSFWTPGTVPSREPQGVASLWKKGADLVVQGHFCPSGRVEQEQGSIGVYFAKTPPHKISRDFGVTTYDIDIPAGEANHKVTSFAYLLADSEVLSIFAHAHFLAKQVKATATLPSGHIQPLLWISNWDFRWQEQYWYKSPLLLPQGTRIDMEFTFDNSAGNPANPNHPLKRVTWGEKSTDEMAEIHLQVVATGSGLEPSAARLGDTLQ